MSKPGSQDVAAALATRAALAAGITRLGIAIVEHVAARGTDWQTDAQMRGEFTRPDGRHYHRESIGRKRRELAHRGFITARRIFPGERPAPHAKFRSSHGTTVRRVVWPALRLAAPTARGAKIRAARRARKERAELGAAAPAPMSGAELVAAVESARAAMDVPRGRPPPD